MRLFRIYTERKRKAWLIRLVAERFDGFTVFDTVGVWNGKQEKSVCIEIVTSDATVNWKLNRISRAICGLNQQDCVLVVECDVSAKLYQPNFVRELT
jgi:hypothetical protein